MNGKLRISNNRKYFVTEDQNGKQTPFFWLGDTAWFLLQKLTMEQIEEYLKDRKSKKFNVLQVVITNGADADHGASLPLVWNKNIRTIFNRDFNQIDEASVYWDKIEKFLTLAEQYGFYVALLPVWGNMVKTHVLTIENVEHYANFLVKRYGNHKNIIWTLGGDVRGNVGNDVWNKFGETLKNALPEQLIAYHPFGRTSSALWFHEKDWLSFNMFQSGHRRYDQASLGAWDDNKVVEGFFGEDNWRYVERELKREPQKPVLDAEPSYEGIPQGLHDTTQPYWEAKDVRRYAYWSVFQGAAGFTYGHNSIMQFYRGEKDKSNYGPKMDWKSAMQEPGAFQMTILSDLMNSVDYQNGAYQEDLLVGEQGSKYERISSFVGSDFAFVYDYTGRAFQIDVSKLSFTIGKAVWFDPEDGTEQPVNIDMTRTTTLETPNKSGKTATDWVLVLKK